MLRLVTVCRPAKVFFYFYSGHPDVCSAIIIIIIIIIIINRVHPSAEAVINECPGQLKN